MQEYVVRQGDILGKIAQQFNISLQDLLKLNPEIKDPDKIFVGQKIKVPGGKIPPPPPPPVPPIPVDIEQIKSALIDLYTLSAMIRGRWKENVFNEELIPLYKKRQSFIVEVIKKNPKIRDALAKEQKGLSNAAKYLSQRTEKLFDRNYKYTFQARRKDRDGKLLPGFTTIERGLFGDPKNFNDIDDMSMIEMGLAYGIGIYPNAKSGFVFQQEYITKILKRSIGIGKKMKTGVPTYPKRYHDRISGQRKPRELKAYNDALNKYIGIEESINDKKGKIIQEYILKNTPSPPKEVSVIEIIADEVNETLNNLPEVQLASEILSEDELKRLFAPLAKQIVMSVHGQIGEKIKGMTVEQAQIDQETLINLIDQAGLDNLSDEDQKKILQLLLNADPDNLEPVDDLEAEDIPAGTGEEEEDES